MQHPLMRRVTLTIFFVLSDSLFAAKSSIFAHFIVKIHPYSKAGLNGHLQLKMGNIRTKSYAFAVHFSWFGTIAGPSPAVA